MKICLVSKVGYKRIYMVDGVYYVCNGSIKTNWYETIIYKDNILYESPNIQDIYDYFYKGC